MITIFTTPKPFKGKFKVIQENAIKSWIALGPKVTVLLIGNEPGTSTVAKKFKIKQIKNIKVNSSGIPYLSALFKVARQKTKDEILAFVNADIILFKDFVKAINSIKKQRNNFLLIGRRTDVNIGETLDFNSNKQIDNLIRYVRKNGKLHDYRGMDYFVYPRNFWRKIPDFTIARPSYDRWFVGEAKIISSCVVDATKSIIAVHQNHDYSIIPGGIEGKLFKKEAVINQKLAGGVFGDVKSADYILTADLKLKKNDRKFDLEKLWATFWRHINHFLKVRFFGLLKDILR